MAWGGRAGLGLQSGGKDGQQEHWQKGGEKGQQAEEQTPKDVVARHPQDGLVSQTSALVVSNGALAMEEEKVKTVITDTGARSRMLGKVMAEELGLIAPEKQVAEGMVVTMAETGDLEWMSSTRAPTELTLSPGKKQGAREGMLVVAEAEGKAGKAGAQACTPGVAEAKGREEKVRAQACVPVVAEAEGVNEKVGAWACSLVTARPEGKDGKVGAQACTSAVAKAGGKDERWEARARVSAATRAEERNEQVETEACVLAASRAEERDVQPLATKQPLITEQPMPPSNAMSHSHAVTIPPTCHANVPITPHLPWPACPCRSDLSNNQLSGAIPPAIWTLTSLTDL
ncbi:unnamed protein product [Closterium sp. NIES-64]|nr:unnamed protein product [Closterium sp. NIES-64]